MFAHVTFARPGEGLTSENFPYLGNYNNLEEYEKDTGRLMEFPVPNE